MATGDPTRPGDLSSSPVPVSACVAIVLALIALGVAGGFYLVQNKRPGPVVTGSAPSPLSGSGAAGLAVPSR